MSDAPTHIREKRINIFISKWVVLMKATNTENRHEGNTGLASCPESFHELN